MAALSHVADGKLLTIPVIVLDLNGLRPNGTRSIVLYSDSGIVAMLSFLQMPISL
ncbi:hypothetical protein OBV_17030 [Oscillibacter valericigenes Sjm18-20]|nr:hypothetical protein OBV_17030 [Oscillibacter valericigenes Sjm18-20]